MIRVSCLRETHDAEYESEQDSHGEGELDQLAAAFS
jgi:hypothetical protein